MIKTLLLIFIVLLSACRSKYDTSKAIEILSIDDIMPEQRLQEVPVQIDDEKSIVNIAKYRKKYISRLPNTHDGIHHNGYFFTTNNNTLSVLDLVNITKRKIKHKIHDSKIYATDSFVLVYNIDGHFSFVDYKSEEILWHDNVTIDGMTSGFVCIEDKKSCYGLSLNGEVVILNLENRETKILQSFAKQSIILDTIYTPFLYENKIIFAVGDSEFAIFDTDTSTSIAQSSYVNNSTPSLFDINLVEHFYKGGNSVVIAHTNGSYALDIFYGRPLWTKNYHINRPFVTENYMVFYDKKTKKLTLLHLETGDIKWIKEVEFIPSAIAINYNKQFVVTEPKGIHSLDIDTGDEQEFKKLRTKIDTSFVHDNNLYYTSGNKIYKVE